MSKKAQVKKTVEKLLEEAIVAVKEQPYEIPENWVWTKMETILEELKNGTTIKQNKDGLGEKVTRIESVQNNTIDLNRLGYISETSKLKDKDYYEAGDIVLSHINSIEHVGKTAIIRDDYLPLVHGMNLLRLRLYKDKIVPRYAQYYMRSYNFRNEIWNRVNRAVNQVSLNQKNLNQVSFPLPPINEQNRIAIKVERLLNKIDEARQLIDEAKETFELRRAAILDRAFRGELTAKWRKEHSISIEEWKTVELDDVAAAIDPQPSHRTPPISNGGVPYIGVKECNYDTGEIDFVNARPVGKGVLDEHIKRYSINKGDFIIGKIGTVGKAFRVPTERNYVLSANVILIQPNEETVLPEFLFYFFQSPQIQKQFNEGLNSTTQAAFGIKKARKLKVNLCSKEEQKQIVKILCKLFEKESKAKKINVLLNQIDILKSSILNKAFRGTLGTNDPTEESAIELLKEVLQEQV